MADYRSILVHLDGSPRARTRLQMARQLAAEHEASITAMLAVAPAFIDYSLAAAGGPEAALLVQQLDDDRRRRARANFDEAVKQPGPAVRWAELGMSPTIGGFVRQGLLNDLIVMGQYDPEDPLAFGTPPDMVESVVTGSGKPVLVVPYAGEFKAQRETVLIAWKATPESAAAVEAALPLLRRARDVHVLCALEELGVGDEAAAADEPRLEDYLQRHGVVARIHRHGGLRAQVGESILSLAADVSADLLVMGCYGHTRLRELLLGGVTRTVLRSMTLPVLMAH